MRDIRRYLIAERHLPPSSLVTRGYWRPASRTTPTTTTARTSWIPRRHAKSPHGCGNHGGLIAWLPHP